MLQAAGGRELEPFPGRSEHSPEPLPTPAASWNHLVYLQFAKCLPEVRERESSFPTGEQDLNSCAMGLGGNPRHAGKKRQFLFDSSLYKSQPEFQFLYPNRLHTKEAQHGIASPSIPRFPPQRCSFLPCQTSALHFQGSWEWDGGTPGVPAGLS